MSRSPRSPRNALAVELKHVRIDRGGRTVLRGVDWTIRPGERWVLLGGNGAGKTQLLKLLSGAVWPTPTGRESRLYRWRGEELKLPCGVQEEIGYLGAERQDKYERYEWNHRVERIVGTGLYRTDIPLHRLTDADRNNIAVLLKKLGIAHLAGRRFLSLSYGERRLTLPARLLAGKPKLLLLDELFNGLDDSYRERVLKWLEQTAGGSMPWVLATHRAEDVPKAATHVAVLEKGRMVYAGKCGRATLARWLEHPERLSKAGRPLRNVSRRSRKKGQSEAPVLVRLTDASVYLDGTAVLQDISFELRTGDCWVLHGPNGSGKSTLLRAIYGDHALGKQVKRAGIEPGVPLERFKRRVGWVATAQTCRVSNEADT